MNAKNGFKGMLLASLLGVAGGAQAAGFALIEQSASGMGNAYAGAAATAEDASTIFFNPAGMTYVEGAQVVGALHLINPNAEFNNKGTTGVAGGEGPDAGDLAFVPNFYYKRDLSNSVKFGIGVNAPFGLKTEYDKGWIGRYQAVKSEVKTVNINPAVAFKVNEQLSLGFGVSAMWAQAELTNAVNFGGFGSGFSRVKGDDWGFGFNLGAIYQASADTRIGVAYRSKVEQHLDGDVKFKLPNPALVGVAPNGGVKADVTLPETFSMSAFSRLNDTWDVMGDVTWTRWSQFQELAIQRDNGALLGVPVQERWKNTLRYSVGLNYRYSEVLKLRAGFAYDEEAIKDEHRTARIPGNDRKWVSLGAGYQMTPATKLDIGYSHLFISDADVDDNQLARGNGRLIGSYDGSVDILSLQVTHNF